MTPPPNPNLYASIDMGTNTLKLTLVQFNPSTNRFFTLHRLKKPIHLGLNLSFPHSLSTLQHFQSFLDSQNIPPSHLRIVATSAVRESPNGPGFATSLSSNINTQVEILSGDEEARLTYLGILQFCPLFDKKILAIDIGGGSTEFFIGYKGNVLFSESLKLGHVTLTKEFDNASEMREYVRRLIKESRVVERVKEFGEIDCVVGSSGTIKAVEKAVCRGYVNVMGEEFVERDWRFGREDLRGLVRRICDEPDLLGFFKGRARFILAGVVLLEEIFEGLGIEEMEVSGYALGEGVVTEMLGREFEGFDLSVNARWRSVLRLGLKFCSKKRMKVATTCAGIARVGVGLIVSI